MVKLALLWHMHQPWYVAPFTGRFELPWVRVHSIKDYYGMAKLLDEFPGIKATFNLVPSLLRQIELYLEGRKDRFQEIFEIAPGNMTDEQAAFLVTNFFSANFDNHIRPFPRYNFLHNKMSKAGGRNFTGRWREIFTNNELTDLQVWFSLSNIDQYYRENDNRVKELVKKGEGFSNSDKEIISEIELEIMGKIIPLYKDLWQNGNIEISTTPYYHPILPLLIDPQLGRSADPTLPEYDLNFNWKDDAELQVSKGLDYMEKTFDRKPDGIWPSEGSLSEDVIGILEKAGINWTATDEKIIERSLYKSGYKSDEIVNAKFIPWTLRSGNIKVFFRDNYISDLIGFHYKNWDQKDAAKDLYNKIKAAGEGRKEDIVLPVILDGENAWEFYSESGRVFLREFYSLVEKSKKVEMVTFSEATSIRSGDLIEFSAGSWINGNFNIWIGDEDDRKGWELIRIVKELIERNKDSISKELLPEIMENLLIAEGSDWFWWYGSENHTDDLETFDRLFRENLINVCKRADVRIPDELNIPVFRTLEKKKSAIINPGRYLTPVIDGKETSIYEWAGCGEIETGNMASAIYISHPVFRKIKYCFDKVNFYLNIEMKEEARKYIAGDLSFEVEIKNGDVKLVISLEHGDNEISCLFGSILESQIPLQIFEGKESDEMKIIFTIKNGNDIFSLFPSEGSLNIRIPTERDYAKNWTL